MQRQVVRICSPRAPGTEVAGLTARKSILHPNPSSLVPQPPNLPLPHNCRYVPTPDECPSEGTKMESKPVGQKYEQGLLLGEPLRERGQGREIPLHLA